METQPLSNDAKESRRGVAMSPRNALLLAALLTFGALVGATRYVPRMLLSHIVALDGQRLALRYVDELAGAFDLPGTPVPLGDFETLQTDLLLGEEELAAATFDLFDTAKFTSAATSQAVSGYVVLNRFGDRMFSSGDPVHRSIDDPIAKRRFEHAKASLSVTTYKLNRLDETSDMVISTIVPLGRTAADRARVSGRGRDRGSPQRGGTGHPRRHRTQPLRLGRTRAHDRGRSPRAARPPARSQRASAAQGELSGAVRSPDGIAQPGIVPFPARHARRDRTRSERETSLWS